MNTAAADCQLTTNGPHFLFLLPSFLCFLLLHSSLLFVFLLRFFLLSLEHSVYAACSHTVTAAHVSTCQHVSDCLPTALQHEHPQNKRDRVQAQLGWGRGRIHLVQGDFWMLLLLLLLLPYRRKVLEGLSNYQLLITLRAVFGIKMGRAEQGKSSVIAWWGKVRVIYLLRHVARMRIFRYAWIRPTLSAV